MPIIRSVFGALLVSVSTLCGCSNNSPSLGPPVSDGGSDASAVVNFVHPGVLVTKGQLDFVKAQIAARKEPWTSALATAQGNVLASSKHMPQPFAVVQCPSAKEQVLSDMLLPTIGCNEEQMDAQAAYTNALLWNLTGDSAYGQKAIAIMNAWASTLTNHTGDNAPLQSAWVASVWPRAGELMRYTSTYWATSDQDKFATMLRNIYLPQVIGGSGSNGNWELSMIEASIGIAVFLEDHAVFDSAVALWKRRVPAYFYLRSDGATPMQPPSGYASPTDLGAPGTDIKVLGEFWQYPTAYVDGLCQETCRDLGHMQLGMAAMTNAAETALIQGVDLYALEATRIVAGYEFNAQYLSGEVANTNGAVCKYRTVDSNPPSDLLLGVVVDQTWEVGYNEFVTRRGLSLPHTTNLFALPGFRPKGVHLHMVWETLTHAAVGSAGLH